MDDAARARRLHQQGDLAGAERAYLAALDAAPGDDRLRHDYGLLLMQTRREAEAATVLGQVTARSPDQQESWTILALCLRACGDLPAALEAAATATAAPAEDPAAWLIRGSIEVMTGDHIAAERSLRRCLALTPDDAEAWHYLGESLQGQQQWREAMQAYARAMAAQPTEIFNVGICAERAGLHQVALQAYQQMCTLRPERADCLARLGQLQALMCDFPAAAATTAHLSKLLEQPPGLLGDDDLVEAFPLTFLPLTVTAKHNALDRYAAQVLDKARRLGPLALPGHSPSGERRLRLGYVSADFGSHAVGHLVRDLFAAHDRSRFEVFGYALRRYEDPHADAIARGFDHFRDCSTSHGRAIAEAIGRDGIDVLVDLGGYTQGARPEVLALRPAPIQLGWLGYIDGQCAPWLDGIILDEQVQPPDAAWPYPDRVLRIPAPLLPAGPLPTGRRDRARFGLPESATVLCSFNNSYKLCHDLIGAWITILRNAAESVLMVYVPPHARDGFLRSWDAHAGPRERLYLVDLLPAAEHADRAASCDLFLDAFRYQAGATAIASIATGLPILSRRGPTPLSRLSVSLNASLGMDELICEDIAGYVQAGSRLAADPELLAAVRRKLAAGAAASGLFNPRRSAAAVEDVALSMHRERRASSH